MQVDPKTRTSAVGSVNQVDASATIPQTAEEILALFAEMIAEMIHSNVEEAKADAAIRRAAQISHEHLTEAITLRNEYLAFLVYEQGAAVAAAARRVGISRQMARRILGHVDNQGIEEIRDGLHRLQGAALHSWITRMDRKARDALVDPALKKQGKENDDA